MQGIQSYSEYSIYRIYIIVYNFLWNAEPPIIKTKMSTIFDKMVERVHNTFNSYTFDDKKGIYVFAENAYTFSTWSVWFFNIDTPQSKEIARKCQPTKIGSWKNPTNENFP